MLNVLCHTIDFKKELRDGSKFTIIERIKEYDETTRDYKRGFEASNSISVADYYSLVFLGEIPERGYFDKEYRLAVGERSVLLGELMDEFNMPMSKDIYVGTDDILETIQLCIDLETGRA